MTLNFQVAQEARDRRNERRREKRAYRCTHCSRVFDGKGSASRAKHHFNMSYHKIVQGGEAVEWDQPSQRMIGLLDAHEVQ